MPKVSRTQKFRAKAASTSAVLRTPLLSPTESPKNDKSLSNNKQTTNVGTLNAVDNNNTLSRGQRKRQAKRDQYLKREKMILSTLKLHKMEEQKQRIDGLDAIKEALVQTIKENQQMKINDASTQQQREQQQQQQNVKSNKTKKDIAQKEITHLNLVLQHPTFKSNPFATMQEHLRNTFAQQAKDQEEAAKKALSEEIKKNEEKKEAKKERIRNAKYEKARRQRRRK